jgi:hypothetical protein
MTSFLSGLKFRKRRKACDICRVSHVKCDGNMPCTYCKLRNLPCSYYEISETNTSILRQQVLQLKKEIQNVKSQEINLRQQLKERQAKKRKIEEKGVIVNDSRLYIGFILYQFSRHLQSKAPFIPESVRSQMKWLTVSCHANFQIILQIYIILSMSILMNCLYFILPFHVVHGLLGTIFLQENLTALHINLQIPPV